MELAKAKITIVGLGLMGGSLALALQGKVESLTGVDSDRQTRELALRRGIVERATASLEAGIAANDLVILAVPVRSIIATLQDLPSVAEDGCMLLDLGSTKRLINQAMEHLPRRFAAIGGHPMCGREKSGLKVATETLYRDQTFILCRNRRTTSGVEEIVLQLIRAIGSEPLFMPADVHDRLVAASSHLPYLVATLLMRRTWSAAQEDARLWSVSASGLMDTTRLAGSGPQMMLEILLTNRVEILRQLEAYGDELREVADLLRSDDEEALLENLMAARQQRENYLEAMSDPRDSGTRGNREGEQR